MLAVCYLLLSYLLGWSLCRFFFPNLPAFAAHDFAEKPTGLSPLFFLCPAWLYFGILPLTWLTYLLAVFFHDAGQPLLPANAIAMGSAAALSAWLLYYGGMEKKSARKKRKRARRGPPPAEEAARLSTDAFVARAREWLRAVTPPEWVGAGFVLALIALFMFRTLSVKDGNLQVGLTVYGDFTPHLSMIRSFSRGINFPTVYTPYAGEDVKYHFLFMFLSGNLEYLGLRLDLAFNLPSILGLFSAYSLLYVFAVKLSGKKSVGALAVAMALFRSSPNALTYLAQHSLKDALPAFFHVDSFLGSTPRENWGIYTINVYVNQRHLAFTAGVLILCVLLYTQIFLDGWRRLLKSAENYLPAENPKPLAWLKGWGLCFWRESLRSSKGWLPDCPRLLRGPGGGTRAKLALPVAAGLCLGMIAFWNGAVVIAALLILFVLALFSDARLSYLLTAVLAAALTLLQSHAFIRNGGPSIRFYFGYLAEPRTFFGVLNYLWLLTGLLLPLTILFFVRADGSRRALFAAFLAPLLFVFTCAMSPDPLSFNHKFVDLFLPLLSVLIAEFLMKYRANAEKYLEKAGFALLCVCLTASGVLETISVYNANQRQLLYPMDDETTRWIMDNTGHGELFLTSNYNLNNVLLSGAECFEIWGSYAFDMGYDTAYREARTAEIYGAESPEAALRLARENRIAYIIVDDDNRASTAYELNEDAIAAACEAVFHSDNRNLTIYRVE